MMCVCFVWHSLLFHIPVFIFICLKSHIIFGTTFEFQCVIECNLTGLGGPSLNVIVGQVEKH